MFFHFAIVFVHETALFADNSCHYVSENAKLIEITDFNSEFESFDDLVFVQFKNKGDSFHGVDEELRKVIIEMLIKENQVFMKVVVQAVKIEENLLKILLDQSDYSDQFDIAESWNNIISNWMILIANQQRKLYVQSFHYLGASGAIFCRHELDLPVR